MSSSLCDFRRRPCGQVRRSIFGTWFSSLESRMAARRGRYGVRVSIRYPTIIHLITPIQAPQTIFDSLWNSVMCHVGQRGLNRRVLFFDGDDGYYSSTTKNTQITEAHMPLAVFKVDFYSYNCQHSLKISGRISQVSSFILSLWASK